MILNLIHRPATGRLRSMFDLQQQMGAFAWAKGNSAHSLRYDV